MVYQLGLQHRLFYGDTAQAEFFHQIPYAGLILGITADDWAHDWMIERADNIIILRESAQRSALLSKSSPPFRKPGISSCFPGYHTPRWLR